MRTNVRIPANPNGESSGRKSGLNGTDHATHREQGSGERAERMHVPLPESLRIMILGSKAKYDS